MRRIHIDGTCNPAEVGRLREYLLGRPGDDEFGPLHREGMIGIPCWAADRIDEVGHLCGEGYTVEDLVAELEHIAETVAPSLCVRVHVGGDGDSSTCVKTVSISGGVSFVFEPLVDEVPRISTEQWAQMFRAFMGGDSCPPGGEE